MATESAKLRFGGKIKLIWKRSYRYHRRRAADLVKLVSEYSEPVISEALGRQGEAMVLAGFATNGCVNIRQHVRDFRGKVWARSEQNLDLVFEKDGVGYGVEVKNTLPYITQADFEAKLEICGEIGVRPVFAVRMMPKTWIHELQKKGG